MTTQRTSAIECSDARELADEELDLCCGGVSPGTEAAIGVGLYVLGLYNPVVYAATVTTAAISLLV